MYLEEDIIPHVIINDGFFAFPHGTVPASISDGDVRRYALQDGNVNLPVKYIPNYNPSYLIRYEKEKKMKFLEVPDYILFLSLIAIMK